MSHRGLALQRRQKAFIFGKAVFSLCVAADLRSSRTNPASRARGSVRRRGGCLRVAPAASSRLRSPDVSPVLRPGWKRLYSSRQPRKPHATGAVLPGRRVGLPRRPRSVQTPRLSCPPATDAHPQQRAPRVAHTCLGYKWEAPAARSRFHHLLERVPGPGRAAHGRPLVYGEEYFKGRE